MASFGKKVSDACGVMVWIQWGRGVNLVGRARKCHKTSACNLVVSYKCYRDLIYYCCRPSKYKTPVQHLYNAGPTSSTLDKHCANATRVLRAHWEVYKIVHQNHSRKTQDNDQMLGQRWWLCVISVAALGQCPVLAGICCGNVATPYPIQ